MTRCGTESGIVSRMLHANLRRAILQTLQYFFRLHFSYHSTSLSPFHQTPELKDYHDQTNIMAPTLLVSLRLLAHPIASTMFHILHDPHLLQPQKVSSDC